MENINDIKTELKGGIGSLTDRLNGTKIDGDIPRLLVSILDRLV